MKKNNKKKLTITDLSKILKDNRKKLHKSVGIKLSKEEKQALKHTPDKVACVIEFDGDINAKATEDLAQCVNIIISDKSRYSEVFIKITSGGGTVNGYGLASEEIKRLKDAGIIVTALIDRVAASGGYMMACVAHNVIAAPEAYVGSIGVVCEMPNVHKFLNKQGVEMVEMTAGKNKRSVTLMGEITDDKKKHLQDKLNSFHHEFISHVKSNRPLMNDLIAEKFDAVFSGDHWTAKETVDLGYGLVDEICTSEAHLLKQMGKYHLIELSFDAKKKGLLSKLLGLDLSAEISSVISTSIDSLITKAFTSGRGMF